MRSPFRVTARRVGLLFGSVPWWVALAALYLHPEIARPFAIVASLVMIGGPVALVLQFRAEDRLWWWRPVGESIPVPDTRLPPQERR